MGTVFDAGNPTLFAIDFGGTDAFPLSVDKGGVDPIDLSGFDRSWGNNNKPEQEKNPPG